jgi:hypothetical protein
MSLSSGAALLSALGAAWLPVLVDAAVKGTVVLVVAFVVSLLARRASERTYSWCWWRVPEGFKGKYRVEVEGDWGPFEVSKEPPEWFSVK